MPEKMITQKLDIIGTIKEGISIGISNIIPIFVNIVLWVLTIWIPYLNVGTTIGLWTGIVTKAGKGEPVPMTEIFDPKYRKYMGEYFLTMGLIGMGTLTGFIFLIVPGIIIGIAWSLALLLVTDKGKNPTEAITMSNDLTYGNKGRMICIYFLVLLAFGLIGFILFKIPKIGFFLSSIVSFLMMFILIGVQASVYKHLTGNTTAASGAAVASGAVASGTAATGGTFCPECGKKNPPGIKFCGSCGAQV